MPKPERKRNKKSNGQSPVIEPAAPKVEPQNEVRRLEVAIIKEAYLVSGHKRTLADLWRLVEEHKVAVDKANESLN